MKRIFVEDCDLWNQNRDKIQNEEAIYYGTYAERILVYATFEKNEWWYWAYDLKTQRKFLSLRTKVSPNQMAETKLFERVIGTTRCLGQWNSSLCGQKILEDMTNLLWKNNKEKQTGAREILQQIENGKRAWASDENAEVGLILLAALALHFDNKSRILLVTKNVEEIVAVQMILRSFFMCLEAHGRFFSEPGVYEITSNYSVRKERTCRVQKDKTIRGEEVFLQGMPEEETNWAILVTDTGTFAYSRRARLWGKDPLPSADYTFVLYKEEMKKVYESAFVEEVNYMDLFELVKTKKKETEPVSLQMMNWLSVHYLKKHGPMLLEWINGEMINAGSKHCLCNDYLHRMKRGIVAIMNGKKYEPEETEGGIRLKPLFFENWLENYLG